MPYKVAVEYWTREPVPSERTNNEVIAVELAYKPALKASPASVALDHKPAIKCKNAVVVLFSCAESIEKDL